MGTSRRSMMSVAALVLVVSAAAACGGSSASDDSGSSAGPGSAPVELTMLTGFTGPDRPAYEALVQEFNDSHPDIHVTMDVQPWDAIAQKLPQSWATGQGPDLATPSFDPSVVFQYVKTDSVAALDDAVGTGEDAINADAFPESVTEAFTVDGELVAVPANLATLVLYYNKEMFAEAGIAEAPTTQADFVADAKALTLGADSGQPSQYGLSLADHATIQMWPVLQWMNGGDIVDDEGCATVSSPESVEALEQWSSLVMQDKISPVGQTGADADTLFSAKKAAMEINGPWAAAGFREAGVDLGIAQVPEGSAGPTTLASTVPLMVAKSSDHTAEAKQFLAWWTGKTAQTSFSNASGFPPVRTDLGDAVTGDAVEFANALPSARIYLPGLATAAQIDSDVYVPLIGKITRGEDVTTSTQEAAAAINEITGCTG